MEKIIKGAIKNIYKYRGLLKHLITRDIKLKYRRSVLGYLWSVLNPLMIMIVMTIVFSRMFRWEIRNYPMYLLCGQVIYNFYHFATSMSCQAILNNAALIKKVYVPKYIFVFSRVTSCFVDFLFSLAALVIVMIITRNGFGFYNLLFVIPCIELFFFSLGIGLFLSQANVFFRDIQYLYGVFCTVLYYLTPIFYPMQALPEGVYFAVEHFNPLYLYVTMFRQSVYANEIIDYHMIIYGLLWAIGAIFFGIIFFKKNQDKFILFV